MHIIKPGVNLQTVLEQANSKHQNQSGDNEYVAVYNKLKERHILVPLEQAQKIVVIGFVKTENSQPDIDAINERLQAGAEFVYLNFDPRTINLNEFIKLPKKLFSQFPGSIITRHGVIQTTLIGLEQIGTSLDYEKAKSIKKTEVLNVILSQGIGTDRVTFINNLDLSVKGNLYGKFRDIPSNPNLEYKGLLDFYDLHKENGVLDRTMYSVVKGIAPGWTTSKYAELLQHGVVPLLDDDYDVLNTSGLVDLLNWSKINKRGFGPETHASDLKNAYSSLIIRDCLNDIIQAFVQSERLVLMYEGCVLDEIEQKAHDLDITPEELCASMSPDELQDIENNLAMYGYSKNASVGFQGF